MPELPEVETVRRVLSPQLCRRRIEAVQLHHPQIIAHPQPDQFVVLLPGQTITELTRRGKFLSLHFISGDTLTLHLRMTGQLLVTPADFPREKHTHLALELDNGQQLRFIDTRRFGRFWYLKKDEADTVTGRAKLGPEPFDERLTAAYLKEHLGTRRKAIKELLLDQSVIAGIGNIYSDEILFAARIYPGKSAASLSDEEWERLADQIPAVMDWATEKNQISPEDYLAGKGKDYRNTPYLKVYNHKGQPCPVCQTAFQKTTIGGRSCCFCPHCQAEA